ncbi:hypothetical protein G6F56_005101 [Rhizopus delemar]|nr:hypothetical protein G6F56_005101 [Rhizopus delemar]
MVSTIWISTSKRKEQSEFNERSRSHLLEIWSASFMSITILEIKESELFASETPMLTIINIWPHMNCFTKLDYTSKVYHVDSVDNTDNTDNTDSTENTENKICMFRPEETDFISLNHSLELLFLTADQIDGDVYWSKLDLNVCMAGGRNGSKELYNTYVYYTFLISEFFGKTCISPKSMNFNPCGARGIQSRQAY